MRFCDGRIDHYTHTQTHQQTNMSFSSPTPVSLSLSRSYLSLALSPHRSLSLSVPRSPTLSPSQVPQLFLSLSFSLLSLALPHSLLLSHCRFLSFYFNVSLSLFLCASIAPSLFPCFYQSLLPDICLSVSLSLFLFLDVLLFLCCSWCHLFVILGLKFLQKKWGTHETNIDTDPKIKTHLKYTSKDKYMST